MRQFFLFSIFLLSTASAMATTTHDEQSSSSDSAELKVPQPFSENLSLDTLERRVASHWPVQFKGLQDLDPKIVTAIRTHFQRSNESNWEEHWADHCDAIMPLIEKVDLTLQKTESSHPRHLRLRKEISRHREDLNVNPLWALMLHFRASLENGNITPGEINLFNHVISPYSIRGLIKEGAWETTLKTLVAIDTNHRPFDVKQKNCYFAHAIDNPIIEEIEDKLQNILSLRVAYPLWGYDKLGVSFLMGQLLRGVHAIGFPNASAPHLKVHGVKGVSPTGFAVHDYLHLELDPTLGRLITHVIKRTDEHIVKGGDAHTFVPFYIPHAVQKHEKMMQTLQHLYGDFLSRLLPVYGKQVYARAMAGLFLAAHEGPTADPALYTEHDLAKVIALMAESARTKVMSEEGWESPEDPLHTSPLTGDSAFSDDEIKSCAQDIFLTTRGPAIRLPESYYKTYPFPDRTEYLKSLVSRVDLTKSSQFIDVDVYLKTGFKERISFSTLYHKWQNMSDGLGLLRMGGVSIQQPDVHALDNPRYLAQQTLTQVQEGLLSLIDSFEKQAIRFAELPQKEGESLAEQYFTWSLRHEQKINRQEKKLLDALS